jgi:hypothetical protein
VSDSKPSPTMNVITIDHNRIERLLGWVLWGEETKAAAALRPYRSAPLASQPLRA